MGRRSNESTSSGLALPYSDRAIFLTINEVILRFVAQGPFASWSREVPQPILRTVLGDFEKGDLWPNVNRRAARRRWQR